MFLVLMVCMPQLNLNPLALNYFGYSFFHSTIHYQLSFYSKNKKVRDDRDKTLEKLISDSRSINESIETILEKIDDDMNKEEISNNEINKALNENKKILDQKIFLLDGELEKKEILF